jgi:tetratricopeptide (TPR) repeat protein
LKALFNRCLRVFRSRMWQTRIMKKVVFLSFILTFLLACGNTQPAVSNSKAVATVKKTEQVVTSHTTENPTPPVAANSVATNSNSGQPVGNSPMAKAVDVEEMSANIEKAASNYKNKPKDDKAKAELSDAYFVRAFALTEVAQYRAALGDFRKGLKLDPNNKEAKEMHDQILTIFKSIGREPPKEGEEPQPLPINKV